MPFDLDFWRRWEGQRLDGRYQLTRCAGEGKRGGALFHTECEGRPASIEIVPGQPAAIAAMRHAWQRIAALSHPALLQVLASGETELEGLRCAYVVVEQAEENLAAVLEERFLTPSETREMLEPLIDGLRYLHAHGFAHGGLEPSNIMASGDQLKLASEGLVPGGDPAADCAAIGPLVQSVLGAQQAAQLPEPFAGIAAGCLAADPAARWNLTKIEAALRHGDPALSQPRSKARWWIAAALASAAILALLSFWPPASTRSGANSPVAAPAEVAAAQVHTPPPAPSPKQKNPKAGHPTEGIDDKPSPIPLAAASSAPPRPPTPKPRPAAAVAPASLEGVGRVMPDIPQAALNTITGRVRLNARVLVDSAGNVIQASLDPPAVSKYFSARVLGAARTWRFPAGAEARTFVLNFELTREQVRLLSAGEIRTQP